MRSSLKLSSRSGIYQSSNVTFFPQTERAFSYGWWMFVARIGGKLVFNSFNYSNTTLRHQSKVRNLLNELGLKIDLEIEAPKGLDHLDSALELYEIRIAALEESISRKGTKKTKNEERRQQIKHYQQLIKEIKKLANKGIK